VSLQESHILRNPIDTPPPRNHPTARSILSSSIIEDKNRGQFHIEKTHGQTTGAIGGGKKPRKKVTLVDPRTELTDEELKAWLHSQGSTSFSPALQFQRHNYPREMARLRRQVQKKKEQREAKICFEEALWAPPKDCESLEVLWFSSFKPYIRIQSSGP